MIEKIIKLWKIDINEIFEFQKVEDLMIEIRNFEFWISKNILSPKGRILRSWMQENLIKKYWVLETLNFIKFYNFHTKTNKKRKVLFAPGIEPSFMNNYTANTQLIAIIPLLKKNKKKQSATIF